VILAGLIHAKYLEPPPMRKIVIVVCAGFAFINLGNVIGVVVARLSDLTVLRVSGTIPQNVNYAVKAKLIQNLLEGVAGVKLLTQNQKSDQPIKSAQEAVAMVLL